MGEAFEFACKKLSLADKEDSFTQMVAERVILLAKRGENDPNALCERVIRSL
jgi:hypothetical protein